MYATSGTTAALGLVLSVSLLSGCGTEARGDTPGGRGENSVVERAPGYVGDPPEKRYREEFWGDHIHDSWNKCHIGENVPHEIQPGEDCWSRLRSQTGR